MFWLFEKLIGYRTMLGSILVWAASQIAGWDPVGGFPQEAFIMLMEWIGALLIAVGANGKLNKLIENAGTNSRSS